ncbi:hypothetical protein ACFY1B_23000 [Streptomyces mirabilis]|uniref:hypothetical protein n=2 Tax=Streptomyces mirabilis TaxID=68239 RepID=UPI003322B21E
MAFHSRTTAAGSAAVRVSASGGLVAAVSVTRAMAATAQMNPRTRERGGTGRGGSCCTASSRELSAQGLATAHCASKTTRREPDRPGAPSRAPARVRWDPSVIGQHPARPSGTSRGRHRSDGLTLTHDHRGRCSRSRSGQVLVRNLFLSLDPGMLMPIAGESGLPMPRHEVGEVMHGDAIGEVVAPRGQSTDQHARGGRPGQGKIGRGPNRRAARRRYAL